MAVSVEYKECDEQLEPLGPCTATAGGAGVISTTSCSGLIV